MPVLPGLLAHGDDQRLIAECVHLYVQFDQVYVQFDQENRSDLVRRQGFEPRTR
jgi:hypothetical protein